MAARTHLIAATATAFHTDELDQQKTKGAANEAYSGQDVFPEPSHLAATSSSCGLTAGKPHFLIQGLDRLTGTFQKADMKVHF